MKYNQQAITVIPPLQCKKIICKADSGESKTYIKPKDGSILNNRNKITNRPTVDIPNGDYMKTIESGTLPLHHLLLSAAKQCNVLEGLNNVSLLSIGQLCNNECIAVKGTYVCISMAH